MPRYTEDVKAAWLVVQKLREDGYDFECRTLNDGKWAAVFHNFKDTEIAIAGGVGYAYAIHDPLSAWEWPAQAKTIEMAICLAALRAAHINV